MSPVLWSPNWRFYSHGSHTELCRVNGNGRGGLLVYGKESAGRHLVYFEGNFYFFFVTLCV